MPGMLQQTLRFWATRWPDRIASHCVGRSITWGELDRSSDQIAAGLFKAGLRKGDRLGILMRNRVEFLQVLMGAIKLGAPVVLHNIRFTPKEMIYPIQDAGIKVVVAETALANLLADAARDAPALKIYTTELLDGCRPLSELANCTDAPPDYDIAPEDVALVCYTSGTTGYPKGAMLTHSNIRESTIGEILPAGMTNADRPLISLPLAYTWGTVSFLRECLMIGATSVIIEPTDGVDGLIDILVKERITSWCTPALLFERVGASPRFGDTDFSHLRRAMCGSMTPHIFHTWKKAGVILTQAWGLTEASGSASSLYDEDAERKMGSCGRAILNCEIKAVDDEGRTLAPNEPGELLVRGPIIMKGYINKPEETAKTMAGDWLRTGDCGTVDEEGFVSIVDRFKDMVRSGGLNIYPAELERVLAGVKGLEEFAIIGVKDDRWGEVPMIVAHSAQPLDLAQLKHRATEELSGYKRPHYFVDHGEPLPRTVSGKIIKGELREAYPAAPANVVRLRD